MKDIIISKIFNDLYSKFVYLSCQQYNMYKEPFKVMYNNDKDFNSSVADKIIYYFIFNCIKETNIIVKNNKNVLSETVYAKFYNYLYTLGMDITKDYKPSKSEYLIKHVISTFIIENNIDLTKYIDSYPNSKRTKNYSIDIVNYFIRTSNRPWKGFNDYINEFMDFFETIDVDYARPKVVNMKFEDMKELVDKFYIKDFSSKPEETQKLYIDMWRYLYGNKYNNITNTANNTNTKFMVYDYFITTHYKPWKSKYNYDYEWKDYIETLNID